MAMELYGRGSRCSELEIIALLIRKTFCTSEDQFLESVLLTAGRIKMRKSVQKEMANILKFSFTLKICTNLIVSV